MRLALIGLFIFAVMTAFVAGFFLGQPRSGVRPSAAQVQQAEKASNALLPPVWARAFIENSKFKGLRERGYFYCYKAGLIDAACAQKQDEAIQSVFFALTVAEAQRQTKDRTGLSSREQEVASNPQVASAIRRYCWNLYVEHGRQDVRVLAVCLGNLTEFSPLVSIPPD